MRPTIPIKSENGEHIATLQSLAPHNADDLDLMRALTEWREKYMSMFMSQFTASVDRTRRWLAKVTTGDDRLFFVIRDRDGELLGQYGLRWDDASVMELDNGILGATTAPPRLMYHTERTVLRWGFETIGATVARARVFSKNIFAIKLHKAVGLVKTRSEPLVLVPVADGERRYVAVPAGTETDVSFTLNTYEVQREAWDYFS